MGWMVGSGSKYFRTIKTYFLYPLILPLKCPCNVVPVFRTQGNCIKRRLNNNRSNGKNIHITIVEKDKE
jgi:hypothetical protein